MNYRHGWNPTATGPTGTLVRRATLLNAVYRAIHDVKESVRYMKDDAANANSWDISSTNMGVYGQGSGGYVALGYVTVDDQSETELTKFLNPLTMTSIVDPTIVGDYNGYGGLLNLYYDRGISADVEIGINAGGALGDISWVDGNEVPMVSIHAVRDQFAPFDTGTVIVPTTGGEVVDVNGPNTFMPKVNSLGVNDKIADIALSNQFGFDPYTQRARSLYGQTFASGIPAININNPVNISNDAEGLFALDLEEGNGAPWEWWSLSDLQMLVAGTNAALGTSYDAQTIHDNALLSNMNMSKTQALTYIDSIQGYIHPRIMRAMEIGSWDVLNTEDINLLDKNTAVYPNPSNGDVFIFNAISEIQAVTLVDLNGKVVLNRQLVNAFNHNINVGDLAEGIYLMQLEIADKTLVKKLVVQ